MLIFKKDVLDWQSVKKVDAFESFNYWNTLYLFPYIQFAFQFSAHWKLYRMCF